MSIHTDDTVEIDLVNLILLVENEKRESNSKHYCVECKQEMFVPIGEKPASNVCAVCFYGI